MGEAPSGEYISLVVRLQRATDGTWSIFADDAATTHVIPLAPMTLVVRLWRSGPEGILRGSIELQGLNRRAPIQSNSQLEELIRAWLLSGDNATGPQ